MTPIKYLLTACAASALMTGAAFAQDTSATGTMGAAAESSTAPADTSMSSDTSVNSTATTSPSMSVDSSSSTMGSADAAAPAPMPMTSTADATQLKAGDPGVTSNQPVADTPENRAKYGAPMSNAGKRTAAKGN